MFEQFEFFLNDKRYFSAGAILSHLGRLLVPRRADILTPEFCTAEIRVLPMKDVLHVFLVLDNLETFRLLPGDLTECTEHDSYRLLSKGVQLSELWMPQYSHGVLLHFMYVHEAEREIIHASA